VAATVLNAMLPVILTLMLGVLAAWHQDFDEDAASVLNRMVMMYALPLALFAGIVATPRSQLEGDFTLIGIVVVGLLGGYIIPLVIAHWVIGRDLMTSTLQAIAIGGPSVAFVGYPVLGYLFGQNAATIPIVVSALVLVLIQIPVSMVLLASEAAKRGDKSGAPSTIGGCIVSALKQPMVWGPVIGFIIMVVGVPIPMALRQSMALLGHATAGVALFASGVILFSRRVTFNLPVAITTLARNILVPLAVWGMVVLLGIEPKIADVAVLTLAIPSAVICVILAVQFHAAEQEMASTLFFSTMLSLPTMGLFIWLLGA
jgi:malonate transporter